MTGREAWVLRAGLDPRTDAAELDAEVPLVSVIEQKEELLLAGDAGQGHIVDLDPPGRARVRPSTRALERVLARAVPGSPTQEERPEMGIIEVEGQGNRVAKIGQGLVGSDLDLSPHGGRLRGRVVASQDASPEGVDRRLRLDRGWHHSGSSAWSPARSMLSSHAASQASDPTRQRRTTHRE